MSNLREPGLGPIVGHTTASSATIWIRASEDDENGSAINENRRTLGVIAITAKGNTKVTPPQVHYFRLRREYDRTGVFTLGVHTGIGESNASPALQPDTKYTVKVGTLTIDDPNPDDDSIPDAELAAKLPKASAWANDIADLPEETSEAEFKTFPKAATPAQTTNKIGFIIGSCRYPGLLWKHKESDAIFKPLREKAVKDASFVLMIGDQIYADMLNRHIPIGLADTFEEFQDRYHKAFGSRHMRHLLRRVPTYMILDDHEIEDNWTQDRIKCSKKRKVYNYAINAYRSYQWIHSPRTYGERLFYEFECGGYPFFVLDTRTQRFMEPADDSDLDGDNPLEDNHLLGRPSLSGKEEPSQLEFLLAWLKEQQQQRGDAPKFIGTSSVFAPSPMSARTGRNNRRKRIKGMESSDSWPAFPETRRAILDTIIANNIQNVVFLAGDIHCSNVAEISFDGSAAARNLKAFCITSSALYWPFPFADGEPSNYVHNSTANGQSDTFDIGSGHTMDYKAKNFTQEDNFCRLTVDKANHLITVHPYDKDGKIIKGGTWKGGTPQNLVSRLKLAPW